MAIQPSALITFGSSQPPEIEWPYIDITHCFKQLPEACAAALVGPLSFCAMMRRLEVPCGVLFKA